MRVGTDRRVHECFLFDLCITVFLGLVGWPNHLKQVMVVDPFEYHFADTAAELNIPALFTLNMYPTWVPPPFPLWPVGLTSTSTVPHALNARLPLLQQVSSTLADWIAPLLLTTTVHIHGWRMYGYPRHLFATVYARPFLALPGHSWITVPLPRSVLVLGPSLPIPQPVRLRAGQSVDAKATLQCHRTGLVLPRPSRLLLVAFGTLVKIPRIIVDMFCRAFRQVLDANWVDAVVFARRPLDFVDSDTLAVDCRDDLSAACGDDSRLWSTTWVNQQELLDSGAVGVFFTHGGYSSLTEALAARTPVVVLPNFGDQPDNADATWARGVGLVVSKQDGQAEIVAALTTVLRDRDRFVSRIDEMLHVDRLASGGGQPFAKAADLIALAATGDHALQRLVSPVWSHYAAPHGPSFQSSTFVGACLWLLGAVCFHGLLLFTGWIVSNWIARKIVP